VVAVTRRTLTKRAAAQVDAVRKASAVMVFFLFCGGLLVAAEGSLAPDEKSAAAMR
jgi:hypothetical protein